MAVEQQSRIAVRDTLYVDGAWIAPQGTGTLEVVEAGTEKVIGTAPEGTPEDARRAVAAARGAFDGWAATPVAERQRLLNAIADGLEKGKPETNRLFYMALPPSVFTIVSQHLKKCCYPSKGLARVIVRCKALPPFGLLLQLTWDISTG